MTENNTKPKENDLATIHKCIQLTIFSGEETPDGIESIGDTTATFKTIDELKVALLDKYGVIPDTEIIDDDDKFIGLEYIFENRDWSHEDTKPWIQCDHIMIMDVVTVMRRL